MTSSGFPMGGERSYYVEGSKGERDEGRGWSLTGVVVIPNCIGSKHDDENNGDSLRGDEALTLSRGSS